MKTNQASLSFSPHLPVDAIHVIELLTLAHKLVGNDVADLLQITKTLLESVNGSALWDRVLALRAPMAGE